MKRKLYIVTGILFFAIIFFGVDEVSSRLEEKSIELAKLKHEDFLANSPFKNTDGLTKKERFDRGLPPDKYLERMWELTMNPQIGRPTPENLEQIRKELEEQRNMLLAQGRVPGDASNNNWVERGPNNVGGRVRAVMFDPNDSTNETVFAGGVSGGLWKNTNISNPSSVWTQVDITEHLNISSIAVDPNDSNVFYVGTGESWVVGQINGNGLWKSEDGGDTWFNVFGGATGEATFQANAKVIVNAPGAIAGEYVALDSNYGGAQLSSSVTGNLVLVDDGSLNPNEGCAPLFNAAQVNGNIAVVYRGNCNFTDKVKNAENAGATGVIVINNVGGPPIVMGGTDPTITIPAVMVSNEDGQLMVDQLGSSVNVTLEPVTNSSFLGFFVVPGNMHINDVIVRNNGGTSEVYVAAGATFYAESNPIAILGPDSYGVYRSTDGGVSWSLANVPETSNRNNYEPNDLELGADNKIWMATRNSPLYGDGGGAIFSSSDGNSFSLEYTLTEASRTQIAASKTDPNKLFVVAQGTNSSAPIVMEKTTNGFTTTTGMSIPVDPNPNIPSNDFANGQAFYDLYITVDPTNDQNVFVGGISNFKSSNEGASWSKITWAYQSNGTSYVHADQHALAFGNGDVTKILSGNDGGVYYSSNSGATFSGRNNGFNVTQFYSLGVAPTTAISGDYFAGGTQDNGTHYFANASAGINSSVLSQGGDGAFTMFDQDGSDTYYISNYVYNRNINKRDFGSSSSVTNINSESINRGDFITQQALDSNQNMLYTNYSYTDNLDNDFFIIRRYDFSFAFVLKDELTDALLDARPTALKVSPYTTTSTNLFVGLENGSLLKAANANGSPTWTEISNPLFFGSVSDIEFGQNENEIFVTMSNYGVESIWYTDDGGVNWETKEGNLPDVPVKTILQNPLNLDQVIIGTDLGVWYTQDFSSSNPTWSSAFNGMSNTIVTDLDLRNDNTIFAATYGRGIFSGTFTPEVLSVNESEFSNDITLLPTVTDGEITIKSSLNLGNSNFEVYNLSGQNVFSQSIFLNSNSQRINLDLASGMYLVQIKNNGRIAKIIKLIIK